MCVIIFIVTSCALYFNMKAHEMYHQIVSLCLIVYPLLVTQHLQATPRTMLGRPSSLSRGPLNGWCVLCVRHWLATQCRPTAVAMCTAHGASRGGRPDLTHAQPAEARSSQIHPLRYSKTDERSRKLDALLCFALIGRMAVARRWIYLKWITTSHQTTAALSRLWTVATSADTRTGELL